MASLVSGVHREPAPRLSVEHTDDTDFTEVFREFAPYVWRALERLGVPTRDLDDVGQDAFMIVHRRLPSFRGRSTLRTWIYGICIRTASDYRRRAHVRREEVSEEPPDQSTRAPQDGAMDHYDARRVLARLLGHLDDDKRAVFVAYELMDLSMQEIAEAVGCPLQTAYSRLHAARNCVEEAALQLERKDG